MFQVFQRFWEPNFMWKTNKHYLQAQKYQDEKFLCADAFCILQQEEAAGNFNEKTSHSLYSVRKRSLQNTAPASRKKLKFEPIPTEIDSLNWELEEDEPIICTQLSQIPANNNLSQNCMALSQTSNTNNLPQKRLSYEPQLSQIQVTSPKPGVTNVQINTVNHKTNSNLDALKMILQQQALFNKI